LADPIGRALAMSTDRVSPAHRLLAAWGQRPAPVALSLLLRASRPATAIMLALLLCRGLLSAGFMLTVGQLLNAVSQLNVDPAAARAAWIDLAVLSAVWIGQQLLEPACALLTGWLSRRCQYFAANRVLAAALIPDGIGHLEDPAMADRISLAQGIGGDSYPPETAVSPLADVLSVRLAAVTSGVLLLPVLWWGPFVIAVAWWLFGRQVGQIFQTQVAALEQRAGTMRRAGYLRRLGTGLDAAKEVRVWGLCDWLIERFSQNWRQAMQELFTRRAGATVALAWRMGLLVLVYLMTLTLLAHRAIDGDISITQLVVGIQAARGLAGFGWVGDPQWQLIGAVGAIRQLLSLPGDQAPSPSSPAAEHARTDGATPAVTLHSPPVSGIRFESVSFRYPGRSDAPAMDLDLWIPAGKSLAIVGENGAGKTTLVKLLAGLYQPQQGRITVDGTDLAQLDMTTWRRQLAVIFQDFVRYEFTARENVTLGRPDRPVNLVALSAAALQAGADEAVAGLEAGWDTVLSRQFGGSELSGGQWQRLALARALYAVQHGAGLLVLDEPTAQLDALAESRLYGRFLELTRGLTTILISHRFNTVRLADRIAVLAGGRVVELGSHDELVAMGGQYAHMFTSQAELLGVAS
jgi:ATP-binding cassette subfamily B protein